MKVILAKSAGFCFGVQRAIDMVYQQIDKKNEADDGRDIYTYGMIIHNEKVTEDLASKGVKIIEQPEDIGKIKGQKMIIRSHGVPPEIYKRAADEGVITCDATCPFVKKIHNIVDRESSKGNKIVIIGDPSHPEVAGIAGWAKRGAVIINNEEEARLFTANANENICIVAQTTFNTQKFKHFVEIIKKKGYHTNVINTICNATAIRQKEAFDISARADIMIVIGDKRSSNTLKLYDICRSNCKDTYHIQTVKDLTNADLQSDKCVGITAGASTPNYLIQEVLLYVRGI